MKHTKQNIMLVLIFLLFICKFEYCYSNDVASCVEGERIALLQFKESLIHTSNRLSSWSGLDCCEWEGISCSSTTGHVLKLDLHNPATLSDGDLENYWSHHVLPSNYSNKCLGGEINHSLINLTHLNYLDLSLNNFSGIRIPEFFGSFKNLRYLNISSSGFFGNIPTHLGNLSSLEYLHLGEALVSVPSYNDLATDNLDWLASLSSLKSLDMYGVSIRHSENWLRTINKLVSLSSLNLAVCDINTTSPLSHVNSTSLISLDLSADRLDSAILPWLSNLTRLEHLNLGDNSLNSSLLEIFEPFPSLKVLDLSFNIFTGTLVPLCKFHKLVFMDLSSNSFQGSIPNSLGNMTSLTSLDLSSNSFTGSIPNSLGNMTSLTSLDLSSNSFTGSIPNTIGSLCRLQVLDLSLNQLTDSIVVLSDCLSDSLKELYLDSNNFIGQLPNQLYKYKNLEVLSLSSNSFSGPIMESLGNLSMLRLLDISNNKFSGSVPSSLGELSNLEELDISNNSLVGFLSEFHFSKLSKLQSLYISSNLFFWNVSSNWVPPFQLLDIAMESIKIGPHFPHWLRTQRYVDSLFISNASISSAIPDWFEKFFWNTSQLDLSKNHISGELPLKPHVEGYMQMSYLSLSNNYLSGGIPKSLCSLNSLRILALSTNQLYGEIPPCLGKLHSLIVLDLGNNNLSGRIPKSLGSLQGLFSLHLQNNELDGKLPSSMQNLTNLMTLDLSENKFMDVIPSWIGEKLLSLKYLIFYRNKFYGDIPLQLCQLQDLQLLNLANNNISGYIPQCFGNFTAMAFDGDHTPIGYAMYNAKTYEDQIDEVVKGLTLQYTKNLQFLISIDLSGNHIVGKIPIEIMSLHALENLNVSRNNLSGTIPEAIGNLSKIESLDLSRNELSGPIPPSLSSLNFLSHLNLSFNYLYGKIPTGSQLQTLNDPSIYMGNEGLCGAPLSKGCSSDVVPTFVNQSTKISSDDDDHEFFMWFYAGLGPGFFVGFIGVLSILLFARSWSYAYFKFLEIAYNKILNCFY
ncbi:PREDICTED: receptor-like protein 12 isoform X3 [Ipomoea nil]|uniref:receptor-like protein 12 isoform X3 n=1 Tax=Ipomoea nil TaxID=35883 RepID=UPI0009012352|nr:PREDICTED: receptor-like protein 12 isoform X3 [Ipomoea nil]